VLRYDQRGHGASAQPHAPVSLHEMVDDAARLVREWGRGPVVFVGLSMGGMVAQGLAIEHPGLVRGLVLANTTSRYPEAAQAGWSQRIQAVQHGGMAAIADMVVERYLSAGFREREPAFTAALRALILRSNPSGYAACCHGLRAVDWQDRLHEIAVPTAVVVGTEDVGTPPEMARAIAERIRGAQLEVFDGVAHLSVAEAPAKFEHAVKSLLARAGA